MNGDVLKLLLLFLFTFYSLQAFWHQSKNKYYITGLDAVV